jgi:Spy/CpxP family protein refolding chaperone
MRNTMSPGCVLACLIVSTTALGQQMQRTGNGPIPAPGTCPAGAVCRMNPGATNGPGNGDANSTTDELSEPLQQKILATAKQLGLSSDQLAQLKESLKADSDQRTEIAKAVQDARKALATALANGETFLDSEIEALAEANTKSQEYELKLWAKLYAILTPDQQRQFLTMATPLSGAAQPPQVAQRQ